MGVGWGQGKAGRQRLGREMAVVIPDFQFRSCSLCDHLCSELRKQGTVVETQTREVKKLAPGATAE